VIRTRIGVEIRVDDVVVEVYGAHRRGRGVDYRDARLGEVALYGGAPVVARAFEAHVVRQLGVGDVEPPGHRVHDHVEQDRADVVELLDRAGRQRIGVNGEDVVVGQVEGDQGVAVGPGRIEPVRAVELGKDAGLGRRVVLEVVVGPGDAVGAEAVGDEGLVDGSRLVAGVEGRHEDGVAVRAHGEGPRRVGEEAQDLHRCAADRTAETRGVEDPDIGAADALGGELWVAGSRHAGDGAVGAVLAAVGRGDEGAIASGAREHDVAGLVAHEQRAHHLGRAGGEVDDADAVREVVRHPYLGVAARRHGDRLHPHRDRIRVGEAPARDVEDLEPVVRRIDRQEPRSVRQQRERPHVPALEEQEGRRHRASAAGG
jgi:hypothetical protein